MNRHSWMFLARHLALALCGLLAIHLEIFESLENKILDQRFRIRGRAPVAPELALVDISTDATSEFGTWPFPRHIHGMFLDATTNLGVRSVIYDVLFSKATDRRSDKFLLSMTANARNVYYPLWFSPYDESFKPDPGDTNGIARHSTPANTAESTDFVLKGLLSLPLPGLDKAARGMGFVNVVHDRDGMVRRTPLTLRCSNRSYQQLVVAAWQEKSGQFPSNVPLDERGNLVINWPGRWQDLPHYSFREILVSYKQVMDGEPPIIPLDSLRSLQGKILLVGHVDPSSQEFISTPLEPRLPTTGLHFAILNTLLTDSGIRIAARWEEMAIALVMLLAAMLFLRRETPLWQAGVGVLFGIYLVASQWAFARHHVALPTISVGTILGMLMVLTNIERLSTERRTRERVKSIFAKYVTKEVMEQLLERPELVELGGRKEMVSILFSDIRGFTALSETLEPSEVVSQLNEYLSVMTPIIFANHGIIDKFVGDEIMAYFGAPVNPENHAWRAVKTAMEMQEALRTLRAKWKQEGRPDIRIGIGLNTGNVVMGNIGSSQYMDFTLIGDSVNLAARLCALASAGEVLLSPATYGEVFARVIVSHSREAALKGRSHLVRIYSVTGLLCESPSEPLAKEGDEVPLPVLVREPNTELWREILSEINGDGFRWTRPRLVDSGTVLEVEIQLPNGIHVTGAKALVTEETSDTGTTYRARFTELSEIDRSEIEKYVLSTNRLRRLGTPET
jgi:adenylate cyclase